MKKPLASRKRALIFSLLLFAIGVLITVFYAEWWPGIILVVGIPLGFYQYLQRRLYDTIVTLLVFVGAFVSVKFQALWQVFLTVIFTIGGIYIFFREMMEMRPKVEEEEEEDLNEEIEEGIEK